MPEMTTHERMTRMLAHREADRVPVTDSPWGATLERWRKEGLPADGDWAQHLGLDRFCDIGVDNGPRYPVKKIEETEEYSIHTSSWGATMKNWKHRGGVPEFLDFVIKDPAAWREAKKRMTPSRDRVNWEHLKKNYKSWREQGAWITAGFWFGFDITHSWTVGTERVLEAMVDDPEWLVDMFNAELDLDLALFQMVWDEGYHFDMIRWPDDMGYKGHPFFSLKMYRELLKPVHRRAAEWAHAKGVKVSLHSCGDVRQLIPDLIELGIDLLNPIVVKAGMDPRALKAQYGEKLAFHGGLNAALYAEPEKLWAEMRRVIPVLKQRGGFLISSDHSVPDSVTLAEFKRFVALARELGSYA
jgi:uroporphyrinogen decarboxylase